MTTNHEHQQHLGKIVAYYDTAQKYYENLWYYGNRGLGEHYGLWTEGVNSRIDAIIKENEVLAVIAQVKPGDLILDAGCGVAGSGIWLAQNRNACVVEVNITESQLNIGQRLANKNAVAPFLDFVLCDYHYLPLASDSIDVFWALESIEHSDNVDLLIREAFRTVKPGGRAVIAGTFKGHAEPTEKQKTQLETGMRAAGAFNDFRTAKEIIKLMDDAGFRDVCSQDVTDFVMPSAHQMRIMSEWGLPGAKLGNKLGIISDIMVDNTAWGTYQEDLFLAGVTSYHIIKAEKT